ncbi:MAG: class I SAM-dependent DNA methyltransferase [Phycisphaerales bacterium]|nr:class I SAM-dependent DNA methyltransferase [Phycisphaerales bacterium]
MTPQEFVAKWGRVELPERAASQEHFLDLCRVLGQPTPASHDATGAEYAFEKGVEVSAAASKGSKGDRGFADVWWRGKFAWEYKRKGKYKTLDEAYRQLCQYREALDNPPLLIVSDIARTEIHTNFTGTTKAVHAIALGDLAKPESLDLLRRVFTDPESLRPALKVEDVTEQAAKEIGHIAQSLRDRGHDPHETAHFLMKCMFCLFAEDTELLPKELFKKLLERSKYDPPRLKKQMDSLFDAMRAGGDFGVDQIAYFNGGLFDASDALELTEDEIAALIRASSKGWESVEPSIFGTLFERSLDPGKRAQIGAHYTSREDIMLVVEPVILRPLRREWGEVRGRCEGWVAERAEAARAGASRKKGSRTPEWYTKQIEGALLAFDERLAGVRVLDPACGSGNFLYVAIQQLLDLEKEVITYGADVGLGLIPHVRPTQLRGIEINPYAAELAQVVIWIGYLQWMRDNGFRAPANPILEPMRSIENRDAILAWEDEAGAPIPVWREGARCRGKAGWPEAEFIVGNPPFLGSRKARGELGDEYVEVYQSVYAELPEGADYCCYWFELALREVKSTGGVRSGLLATQGIRGGSSREVLKRIKRDGTIFFAESDRPWVLDGAAVRISMVGFAETAEDVPTLDGLVVAGINSDLTAGSDLTSAEKLRTNSSLSFQGTINSGAFDVPWDTARQMLDAPNPVSKSNIDVLRPWSNGRDVTSRTRGQWVVDFGVDRGEADAAQYEVPFAYLMEHVRPQRDELQNGKPKYAHSSKYPAWQLWNTRHEMRARLAKCARYIATPRVAKHRLFKWFPREYLPDAQVIVFARPDDYFFGVLHSSVHELWALRQGTQLESRPRYTPTTCFETFPLPWAPGSEPEGARQGEGVEEEALSPTLSRRGRERGPEQHALWAAISAAARELDAQRERWLNPPEWVAEIAAGVDAADDFADVRAVSGEEARRLIRQSAIDAAAARDPRLKKRTLTNLYNERPTWLRLAHERLDRAVLAAYAAVDPEGGWDPDWARVWVETGAGGGKQQSGKAAKQQMEAGERGEVEERVLGALLRLNQQRASV